MTTLEEVGLALEKADAAGNVEDARELANYYRQLQTSQQAPKEDTPSRTGADIAKDIASTAGKGAVGAVQDIVGLTDLIPSANTGKYLEEHGISLEGMKNYFQDLESPQMERARKNLSGAKGAGNILSAAVENPSAVAELVGEQIPAIFTGAGVVGKAVKYAPSLAKYAPAIGEAIMGTGAAAEQLRQESPDKELSTKGKVAAIGQGAIDGLVAHMAGKLITKAGGTNIEDSIYDTIAKRVGPEAASDPKFVKGIIASTLGEGAEEALQSGQEQIWDNYAKGATNLPSLLEGATDQATMGAILGSVMGGGIHTAQSIKGTKEETAQEPQPSQEPTQEPAPEEKEKPFSDQSRQVDIENGVEAAGVDPEDHPELYKDLTDPKHYQSEESIQALEKRLQGESETLPSIDDKAWEAHLDKQREYINQTPPAAEEAQREETLAPETQVAQEESQFPETQIAQEESQVPETQIAQEEGEEAQVPELEAQTPDTETVTATPVNTGYTVESLQPHLTPEMKRLVESGKLTLHDTADTLPSEAHPENVQGYTSPQGEVHLLADKLTPETLPKVAMHEMGVHVGMRGMVGDKVWGNLTSQALKNKGSAFEAARQAVPDSTPDHLKGEEVLGYLVENAPKLPIVKRAVSAVKNWARTTFGANLNLTEADAAHLATSALRRESTTPTRSPRNEGMYSVPQQPITPNSKLQAQIDKDRQSIRTPPPKKSVKEKFSSSTSAKNIQKSMDTLETQLLSHDARYTNELRRALEKSDMPFTDIGKVMDQVSQSQTVNDTSMSAQAAMVGGMVYEETSQFWVADPKDDNVVSMRQLIDDTQAQYGWSEEESNKFFTIFMTSRRLKEMYQKTQAIKARANVEKDEVARRALNKDAKVIQDSLDIGGISEKECDDAIAAYGSVDNFVKAADMWARIRPNVIKTLVDSGLYSKDKAEAYLDAAFYTPMWRVMHEETTEESLNDLFEQMANGQYRPNISSLTKGMREQKFKGSKREVFNMMDNIEHWVQISYSRAIRAKKATDLVDSVRRYMPEGTITRLHGTKSNKDGAITCYFHGKKQYWKFEDPLMAVAFYGTPTAPFRFMGAHKLMSNLRDSIVLMPTFTISQLPQDIYAAAFSSGIKNPVKLFTKMVSEFGVTAFSKRDTEAHTVLKNIGAVGTKDTMADSRNAHLYDTVHHTDLSKNKTAWRKLKAKLEKFAMAGDNAIRQAVYARTMEELKGDPRAKSIAYQRAFDVINFRRRGASAVIEQVRSVTPFMGAALQAQRAALQVVAGRGLAYQSTKDKKSARQRLFTTSVMMMASSLLYNMLYGSLLGSDKDDDKEALSKTKFKGTDIRYKDTHIMPFGASSWVSIPVRPDIFALPYVSGNHIYSTFIGESESPRQAADALSVAAISAFGMPLFPPVLKEIVEQTTNYDMYTDRPIVPERLRRTDPAYQYDSRTSALGKLVGQASSELPREAQISPIKFDHFLKGYFGGMGTAVMALSNTAKVIGSDNAPKERTWREAVRSFPSMSNLVPPDYIPQATASYYDLREKVEGARATYNAMVKEGRVEDARDYMKAHKNLLNTSITTAMNQLKSATDKIHQSKRIVENNKNLSSQEKAKRIKVLDDRERSILSKANRIYERVYP